jgi:hypothetical protein
MTVKQSVFRCGRQSGRWWCPSWTDCDVSVADPSAEIQSLSWLGMMTSGYGLLSVTESALLEMINSRPHEEAG